MFEKDPPTLLYLIELLLLPGQKQCNRPRPEGGKPGAMRLQDTLSGGAKFIIGTNDSIRKNKTAPGAPLSRNGVSV